MRAIAVHEDDGVFLNQFLHSGPRPVTYWNPGTPNVGSHATNVAGVIASTHNWRRGGAFGISEILSANFQSFANAQNIVNSAGWAIRSGADAINMSWGGGSGGGQTFFTAWVDHLVKNFGVPIVISSGNDTNFVLSPSLGWNTISVGSYFDNNTGGQSDDAISVFSSYRNPLDPVSGVRYEKPDLMAMGGQVIGRSLLRHGHDGHSTTWRPTRPAARASRRRTSRRWSRSRWPRSRRCAPRPRRSRRS